MRRFAVTFAAAVLAVVVTPAVGDASAPATLVRLTPSAACLGPAALLRAGAERVDGPLRLWRVPHAVAPGLVQTLRTDGAIAFAERERTYAVAETSVTPDPFEVDEWWRQQIGIDGLTPPGPGAPITIVDSGLDLAHPEFVGRADTVALNAQEPAGLGGNHGTSVASVIGAPANGVGVVGIYPQAVIRSWDAALGAGTSLDSGEIAAGILAAARAGRGVINLSVGGTGRDRAIELAVDQAVASGSLIVAASGNSGEEGNPIGYPAALPHVTTVAATGPSGRVASFSSRSPYVDLAAPGEDIVVAKPQAEPGEIVVASAPATGPTWVRTQGTSFSSPIVAGAAAWIWTVRPELTASQLAEILRRSARDLGAPGRDPASGFGMLDVAAALALPAPVRDPYEPNDDIDEVSPGSGDNVRNAPPLTTRTKLRSRIAGRVDEWEDAHDVFRVWLPARTWVVGTLKASDNADLALFAATAQSVEGRFAAGGRLARTQALGTSDRLVFRNTGRGRWAYLAVTLPPTSPSSTYTLSVVSRARPPATI